MTCDEQQVINANARKETFHRKLLPPSGGKASALDCGADGVIWFSDFPGPFAQAVECHITIRPERQLRRPGDVVGTVAAKAEWRVTALHSAYCAAYCARALERTRTRASGSETAQGAFSGGEGPPLGGPSSFPASSFRLPATPGQERELALVLAHEHAAELGQAVRRAIEHAAKQRKLPRPPASTEYGGGTGRGAHRCGGWALPGRPAPPPSALNSADLASRAGRAASVNSM